ncbi:MAG: hypothetical protein NDI60_04405 [Elusimicrobiales bacterium]|nr:hypothetical protein [Elusimicrobiales bacterium]
MENAISLSVSELPGLRPAALKGYDRVYIGSEFCQNKLPSAAAFLRLEKLFKGPVTLATPLLTDGGLDQALALIKKLAAAKRKKPLEVVVNDWGLLRLLKKNKLVRPVLGRLLMWEIGEMDKPFLNAFCREYRVAGVETDSAEVLAKLKGVSGPVHFHYPFGFKSVTRYCSYIRDFNSSACALECGPLFVRLSSKAIPEPIYMQGNAYFIPNKPLRNPLIKRLIKASV